jgi:hypothetical protein
MMPKYTVKGIKTFQGREGIGYECSLYRDHKRIGKVVNVANGGESSFYLDDREKEILDTYCKTLPPIDSGRNLLPPLEVDAGLYIEELVNDVANKKWVKEQCKKNILFKVPEKEWRTMPLPLTVEKRIHIITNFGENVYIANDHM